MLNTVGMWVLILHPVRPIWWSSSLTDYTQRQLQSTVSSGSSNIDNMVLALASLGPIVDTYDIHSPPALYLMFYPRSITSVCMSRFILNLIATSLDEDSSHVQSSQWKTLHFATVAESVATLGADLSGPVSGTESTTDGGGLAEGTVYTVDD